MASAFDECYENDAQAARVKRDTTVATQVRHSIRDCLYMLMMLTPCELDSMKVNGLTCRERLTQDKEYAKKNPGAIKFGKTYFNELRALYSAAKESAAGVLKLSRQNPPTDGMYKAFVASLAHPPRRNEWREHLNMLESKPSNEDMRAIMIWLSKQTPAVSEDSFRMVTLETIARLRIQDVVPQEYEHVRDKVNATLEHVPGARNRHVGKCFGFSNHYTFPLRLMLLRSTHKYLQGSGWMPISALSRLCFQANLSTVFLPFLTMMLWWRPVTTSNSSCKPVALENMQLFGPLMRKVAMSRFRGFVTEKLKDIAKVELVTEAAIMDWVRDASLKADQLPGADLLPASRTALIRYQKQAFSIVVKSKYEELELHAMAAVRGWASAAGQIEQLPGEDVLVPAAQHMKPVGKVESSAVMRAGNARREFLAIVKREKGDVSGERIKD
eukprot:923017-Amphidinium_carterae.2